MAQYTPGKDHCISILANIVHIPCTALAYRDSGVGALAVETARGPARGPPGSLRAPLPTQQPSQARLRLPRPPGSGIQRTLPLARPFRGFHYDVARVPDSVMSHAMLKNSVLAKLRTTALP